MSNQRPIYRGTDGGTAEQRLLASINKGSSQAAPQTQAPAGPTIQFTGTGGGTPEQKLLASINSNPQMTQQYQIPYAQVMPSYQPELPPMPGDLPLKPKQDTYYDRPEMGLDLNLRMGTLSGLESDLRQKKANMDAAERMHDAQAIAGTREAYRQAQAEYMRQAQGFAKDYQAYDREIEAWKTTIRDEAAIQAELDQVNQQLEEAKNDPRAKWMEALGFMANKVKLGSLANVGDRESASKMENAIQGMQDNTLVGQLEARKKRLEQEKYWQQYYANEELRETDEFTARAQYHPVNETSAEAVVYNAINQDPEEAAEYLQAMAPRFPAARFGRDIPLATEQEIKRAGGEIHRDEGGYAFDGGSTGVYDANLPVLKTPSGEVIRIGGLTQDEKEMFNYIYAESPAKAMGYLEQLQNNLDLRAKEEMVTNAANYAKDHPVNASVVSVASSIAGGPIGYIGQAKDYLLHGYVDENADYNDWSRMKKAMVGQVSGEIEKKWGKAGSFAYMTAMSMAEFLYTTAMTGGVEWLNLGIMGSGAAADATLEAKERGLSDGQAFALGTIAGGAEILTEKVSLEALLNPNLLSDGALRYILKNTLAEGSEEVASDLINMEADILIAGDRAQILEDTRKYQSMGKSEQEAFGLAMRDQAVQMGLDFAGGAISGGLMGTGGAIVETSRMNAAGKRMQEAGVTGDQQIGMIEQALASGDETAQKVAARIQEKINSGKKLTSQDLGQLNLAILQAEANAQQAEEKKDHSFDLMEKLGFKTRKAAPDQSMRDMNQQPAAQAQQPGTDQAQSPASTAVDEQTPVKTAEQKENTPTAEGYRDSDDDFWDYWDPLRAEPEKQQTEDAEAQSSAPEEVDGKAPVQPAAQTEQIQPAEEASREAQTMPEQENLEDSKMDTVITDDGVEVSRAVAEQAKRISKDLGREIVLIDKKSSSGSTVNGYYEKGKIYVNVQSRNPMAQVVGHELTHSLESTAEYNDLSRMITAHIGEAKMEQLRQEIRQRYADAGVTLDGDENLNYEVVAEYVEKNLLTSEKDIENLVRQQPTIAQRIKQAIDKLLAKLGSKSAKERQFLRRVSDTYAKALMEADDQAAQQRKQGVQQTRDYAASALAAGEISEEEYDAIMDSIDEDAAISGIEYSISEEEKDADTNAREKIKVYRGYNRSSDPTKRNLARMQGLENFIPGYTDTTEMLPLEFYTEDKEDAQGYAEHDRRYFEIINANLGSEYNENVIKYGNEFVRQNPDKSAWIAERAKSRYKTLTGKDAPNDGYVQEHTISPKKTLDITKAGSMATIDDIYTAIAEQTGIPESEIDDALILSDIGDDAAEGDEIPTYMVVKNGKGMNVGTRFVEFMKKNGYDALKYEEDGVNHYAVLTKTDKDTNSDSDIRDSISADQETESQNQKEPEMVVQVNTEGRDAPPLLDDSDAPPLPEAAWNHQRSGGKARPKEHRYYEDALQAARDAGDLTEDQYTEAMDRLNATAGENLSAYQMPEGTEDYLMQAGTKGKNQPRGLDPNGELMQRLKAASNKKVDPDQVKITREQLNHKAADHLKKAENRLVAEIKSQLGLDTVGDRAYIQDAVAKMADQILQTNHLSKKAADSLFEKIYQEGAVYDRKFYDQYKPIKDYLRTTAVTLNGRDIEDIADFNSWKMQTRGRLRIVKSGGLPVDTAYQELHSAAPELFPETITHPADQLQRMYEVADSIRISEYHLEELAGEDAEQAKLWARDGYNSALATALGGIRNVRRYGQETEIGKMKEEAIAPKDAKEAAEVMESMKTARRNVEKVTAKYLLTDADKKKVGKLLTGEMLPEDLDYRKDNVKGIMAVYEAKKEYGMFAKSVEAWKKSIKSQMRADAKKFTAGSINWQDKKAGIFYDRETMRRNIYDIVPDKAEADRILKKYFEPVAQMEARSTEYKTKFRDKVKALQLSRKVDDGNQVSEAHAVQLYGEAMDNINYLKNAHGRMSRREGKTLEDWEGIVEDLWISNPNLDQGKIKSAVKQFSDIYEELFKDMNRVRVENGYEPINHRRGYFPHFQEDSEENLMAAFGRALGIDTGVDVLPTSINGITHTFKPGITWFGHAQERKGFDTAYDAVEGFDKYIEGVSSVVWQTRNIQQLRALAAQIRYDSTDQGIRDQIDAINADKSLSEETKELKIKEVYEKAPYALSNFVNGLEEYTNILANKKSKYDRMMESMFSRKAYTFMKTLENRVAGNMIAANLGSAMTNFIPLTQTWSRVSTKNMLSAMWDTLANIKQSDGLMATSDFYINRKGSDTLVKTKTEQISDLLGTPMEMIDGFVTESVVRAAYQQYLDQGLSEAEAMHQADLFAADVMADRSKGAAPTIFAARNPVFKAVTQFQLEVNNQFSELFKDMPRYAREKGLKALSAALLKYFLGAWIYNQLFEKMFGRKPALDPFSMINDTTGDLTGYKLPNLLDMMGGNASFHTEKKGLKDAGINLASNIAGELPFSAGMAALGFNVDGGRLPVASAIPNIRNIWAATADGEISKKKRQQLLAREASKLMYVVPPFAGGQAMKTFKGLKAYFEGGSYTYDNEGEKMLQYPIYKDNPVDATTNFLVAALMGKNATGSAREWTESGFQSLDAKGTALYNDLKDSGLKDRKAYDFVRTLHDTDKTETKSKAERQRDVIRDSGLTGEQKAIAYYGTLQKDSKDRLTMDKLDSMGADPSKVAETLMAFRDVHDQKGESSKKREILLNAELTEEEKKTIYRDMLLTNPISKDADIDAFAHAGLDFDEFLRAQNAYTAAKDQSSEARDQAKAFAKWVQDQPWTARQKETARENMKFFQMFPVTLTQYEKMLDSGIPEEKAFELSDKLDKIKGDGYETKYRRWQTITGAGLSDQETMSALGTVMAKDTYKKVEYAYSFGVSPKTYVQFQTHLYDYDLNGNGDISNKEVTAACEALRRGDMMGALGFSTITDQQLAALWQLRNYKSKPRSNPYDKEVAQQIYDLTHTK